MSRFLLLLCLPVAALTAAQVPPEMQPHLTKVDEALIARLAAACPPSAPARPVKPRRLLVFSRGEGFVHNGSPIQFHHSISVAEQALVLLGERTGAWTTEVSYDYGILTPEGLAAFDGLVLNSTTNIKLSAASQQALVAFVRSGKGLVALHSVVEGFGASEYADMRALVGGASAGHPWGHYLTWKFRVEEPDHPLTAHFGAETFSAKESMYQFDTRTSRANVRVLLSMDMGDPATARDESGRLRGFRTDGLNPVAWVRHEGQGRVYVNAMGNNDETYWNPAILKMHLAGVQYALGDLNAPDSLVPGPAGGRPIAAAPAPVVPAVARPAAAAPSTADGTKVPPEMLGKLTKVDAALVEKVAAAVPDAAPARPALARRLLVFSRSEGFVHHSISVAEQAVATLGRKTGAWTTEVRYDYEVFTPANLARFDAVVLNGSQNLKLTPAAVEALTRFVRGGKGLVALQSAVEGIGGDELAPFRKMLGGVTAGHPWGHDRAWRIKVEEPAHPLTAHLGAGAVTIKDQVYQFDDRTSRSNVRVLLSMDMSDADTARDAAGQPRGFRKDGLNPVAWVRREEAGRVYVNVLGNNDETYWDPRVLRMHLAGIQYALGDLQVPDVLVAGATALPAPQAAEARPVVSPAPRADEPAPKVGVAPAFPGADFSFPVAIVPHPSDKDVLLVVEKGDADPAAKGARPTGRVVALEGVASGRPTKRTVFELKVKDGNFETSGECGLLGFALHPDVARNRQVFAYYSFRAKGQLYQRLSRFLARAEPPFAVDPDSEQPLVTQADPAGNHNGGDLHFGSDGYLYFSCGDGGAGNDVFGHGGAIDQGFFAAVYRIDVDRRAGSLPPSPDPAVHVDLSGQAFYAVPADNPFVHATAHRGRPVKAASLRTETWATGLRNPWRFCFDPVSGVCVVGDVGQNLFEEVDVLVAGGDYGWSEEEGRHLFRKQYAPPTLAPADSRFQPPVFEYDRKLGSSVTGGVFAHGAGVPLLRGSYVFGDFVSGRLFAMREHEGKWQAEVLARDHAVTAFGVDPSNGDVLFVTLTGQLKRLVPLEKK